MCCALFPKKRGELRSHSNSNLRCQRKKRTPVHSARKRTQTLKYTAEIWQTDRKACFDIFTMFCGIWGIVKRGDFKYYHAESFQYHPYGMFARLHPNIKI